MTATELVAALRAGEVSATDVVTEHLAALTRAQETCNAVVGVEMERALSDAAVLDRTWSRQGAVGEMHGLPVTVKDWIDVEGYVCAGGSEEHRNRRPATDATVVKRLRAAGAVVVAKTRVWGRDGPDGRVLNPFDRARTVGGSSSGEAAVVACAASPLGLGSDSGGSIRLPAAWCGVFGLKPTAGRVPTTGHFPRVGALSDGRTQIGPLARSVDDLELALAVICGPDCCDAGVAPVPLAGSRDCDLGGTTYAVLMPESGWDAEPAVLEAVEVAAASLTAAGLRRVGCDLVWLAEALDVTQRYWRRSQLTGAEAERQLWDWDRLKRRYLRAVVGVDVLVTPTVRETAPLDRAIVTDDFIFTLPASLTGSPVVAVPLGRDGKGLPLSVQVIGRPWEDDRVLAAARVINPSSAGQP